jgi:hypothetical protein
VKTRAVRRYAAWLALAIGLGVAGGVPPNAAAAPCEEASARTATAAALRPPDVLLAISAPRAGETIVEVEPSETITVAVDYWGPRLVPASSAHAVDEYHLVYFLDADASAYLGSLLTIPHCDPHIVHSSETHLTFDHVMHGSHSLQVMLTGSNDVSVNPPVAASVTFMVR